MERTLGIVKPDGVEKNLIGEILSRVEKAGLTVIAARMTHLSDKKAEGFYAVHSDKPFFGSLVSYMTRGPIFVFAMEGKNAISKWRELMGATNPKNAEEGTIRKDFGEDIETNTVHGSDAPETAQTEIKYFFSDEEICSRA